MLFQFTKIKISLTLSKVNILKSFPTLLNFAKNCILLQKWKKVEIFKVFKYIKSSLYLIR